MRQKRENKIKTFVKSIKNTKKRNVMLLWNHRNVNFKSLSRTVFTKNGSIKCTEHFLLVRYSLRCSESESRSVMTPWTIQSMEFSRPEYWCGWSFLSPGDLPNPGIEPRSPALQTYSLPAEPPGKPKNTGVGSLSLYNRPSRPRNWTKVSCITGRFVTDWATREAHVLNHFYSYNSPSRKM